MKFEEVRRHVEGVPFMSPEQGKILYDFVRSRKPADCLELGFAHGVSVCYVAAALQELGRGHVTAVDLEASQEWQQPSIEDLLDRTGLHDYVTVVREKTSYTWTLKKLLEQNPDPARIFDFCYIDGPKNWTIDGLAFFLVDKLLRQDGWVLFDDLTWTYGSSSAESRKKLEEAGILVNQMGEDELNTPQVELIFRHLVMTHPGYSEFRTHDDWAWAHKVASSRRVLTVEERVPLTSMLKRGLRKLGRAAIRARTAAILFAHPLHSLASENLAMLAAIT